MIYSNTHDDPKAYSHTPSETRRRSCTIPTSWRYHGRTGTQRATVSGPGPYWPLPSIPDSPSTERGPSPVSGGSRKVTKTSYISGCTQNQYLGTYPKTFQFSRIELRWDFIPGRDRISVRLTLGLRKLPHASRSPQRAQIREDVCLPCVCPTPPGGPDRVFPASRPSREVVSCVALGLPGHPPKGAVPRYPPRGVLRDWSRPVPGSCRGVVSPLTGGLPHISPTSGPASRGTGGGVSPPPR